MGDVAKGIKSFKGMASDVTDDTEPKYFQENQDKNNQDTNNKE